MKSQFMQFGPRLRALRLRFYRSQQVFEDYCQTLGLPITRNRMANWETDRAEILRYGLHLVAREHEREDLVSALRLV